MEGYCHVDASEQVGGILGRLHSLPFSVLKGNIN